MKKFDIKAWQEKQGIKGNFFNTAAPSKNKKAKIKETKIDELKNGVDK